MNIQRIKIGKSYVDLAWLKRQKSLTDVIAHFNGSISEALVKEVWETIHGMEAQDETIESALPETIEPEMEIEETVEDEVKPSNKNKNRGGK